MMADPSHPWLSFNITSGDMLVIMETDNAPAWLKHHDDLKDFQAEIYVKLSGVGLGWGMGNSVTP